MIEQRRHTPLRLDQADYDRAKTLADALTGHTVSDILRILIHEALTARENVTHPPARVSHPTPNVTRTPKPDPAKPVSKVEAARRLREDHWNQRHPDPGGNLTEGGSQTPRASGARGKASHNAEIGRAHV